MQLFDTTYRIVHRPQQTWSIAQMAKIIRHNCEFVIIPFSGIVVMILSLVFQLYDFTPMF
jgi:hypothetical protein